MPRDNHRKLPEASPKLGGQIKPLSKFGYADFMKLAANSYRSNNFGRAVDNCRLAVEMAERGKDLKGMAEAYDLWINSLLAEKKYQAIKKLCCEARSKLGNYLDLVYYEFQMAHNSNDPIIARKLATEFIEIKSKLTAAKNIWGVGKIDKFTEIREYLDNMPGPDETSKQNMEMEK
jgi:hypothetical protein